VQRSSVFQDVPWGREARRTFGVIKASNFGPTSRAERARCEHLEIGALQTRPWEKAAVGQWLRRGLATEEWPRHSKAGNSVGSSRHRIFRS